MPLDSFYPLKYGKTVYNSVIKLYSYDKFVELKLNTVGCIGFELFAVLRSLYHRSQNIYT